MIGFSLGGAISLDFVTMFPWLVDGIVLLGPAGLMRGLPENYRRIAEAASPLKQSDPLMNDIVEEILGVDVTRPLSQALRDRGTISSGPAPPPSNDECVQRKWSPRTVDVNALVQWQYEFNKGHVYSFYDTVRHGPRMHQEYAWRALCDIVQGKTETQPAPKLTQTKLLVVFGSDDDVIIGHQTQQDILKIFPEDKIIFKYVPGGHGFVYPNSNAIVDMVADHWRFANSGPNSL